MPETTQDLKNTWSLIFTIIRAALTGDTLTEDFKNLPPKTLRAILALSLKYDIAHLLATPLLDAGALDKDSASTFQNVMYSAVMRYEQMHYELDRMAAVFDLEKIPYIPLKGAVMREYYPEPWMRTSCGVQSGSYSHLGACVFRERKLPVRTGRCHVCILPHCPYGKAC